MAAKQIVVNAINIPGLLNIAFEVPIIISAEVTDVESGTGTERPPEPILQSSPEKVEAPES